MTTPTVGTIPALTEYQPGALPIASTVQVEITDSASASTALSYRMSQADFVGKAPGIMVPANPVASDVVTFLQVANNLPRACTIGSLGIPSGNLPTGGGTGTFLSKLSSTNWDTEWATIASKVSAGTSVAVSGSTTITVSVANFGITSTQIATNAVGNVQFRQGAAISVVGVTGNSPANVADIVASGGTQVLQSNAAGNAISFGPLTTAMMPVQLQLANITAEGVIYGNGTGVALAATNFGTTGMFLMGNGSSLPPGFALVNLGNSTSVIGTTQIVNGGSGTTILTPFGVMLGGTTIVSVVPAVTSALPLVSTGSASAPAYSVLSFAGGGSGTSILATPWGVVIGGTTALGVTAAGATGTLLAGVSATAAPTFITVSAALDTVNTTQGTLLYRNNATWLGLAGGTAGYLLQTLGTAANPQWVGSAGVLLNTIAASQLGSAVDTTSFTSRYSRFRITFENICPVSTATLTCSLNLQVATSGTSWISANYVSNIQTNVGLTTVLTGTSSLFLLSGLLATTSVGTSTLYGVNGYVDVVNPANAVFRKSINGELNYITAGAVSTLTNAQAFPSGFWDGNSNAIVSFAVAFQTGNIATGTIRIYGMA